MELKDKVYVHRNTFGDLSAYEEDWCRPLYCVEYTRTDAFIEKACEWLEKNVAEATWIDSYAITKSFKQAMKGE